MELEFNAENNDGRCCFCDEQSELTHHVTVNTPQGVTKFSACLDCCTENIADKLSDRVKGVIEERAAQHISDAEWEREAR